MLANKRTSGKSADFAALSDDADFLKWVADSGHLLNPAKLVFKTLAPALTWEYYQRNQVSLAHRGVGNLQVGYPILAFRKDGQVLSLPLFHWEINLEPVDQEGLRWMFSRLAQPLPQLNHQLMQLPELNPLLQPYVGQGWETDLDSFRQCIQTLDSSSVTWDAILPLPDASFLLQPMESWRVYPSGVFYTAEETTEDLSENLNQDKLPVDEWVVPEGHHLGAGILFPEQATAFHGALGHKGSLIIGTAGTGKRFLLRSLVVNALSNQRTCLILSRSTHWFADLKTYLAGEQLGNLTLFPSGPEAGAEFLKKLGDLLESERKEPDFGIDAFRDLMVSWQSQHQQCMAAYEASRNPIFGNLTWWEVCGLFLESVRESGGPSGIFRLPTEGFTFQPEEFEHILAALGPLQKLFHGVKTLQHPLIDLNPDRFQDMGIDEERHGLEKEVEGERQRFRRLLADYLDARSRYADELNLILTGKIQEIQVTISSIEAKYQSGLETFGRDFPLTRKLSLALYSRVSPRGKRIELARQDLEQHVSHLLSILEGQRDWVYPVPPFRADEGQLPQWMAYLAQLKVAALSWQATLPAFIQEEVLRASSQHVHPQSALLEDFRQLENAMDEGLNAFNAGLLLREPVTHHALTLSNRQKWLEGHLGKLDLVFLNLRDFPAFRSWQGAWENLSPTLRSLVRTLATVQVPDWVASFRYGYLHQVLLRNFRHQLPDSLLHLEDAAAEQEKLQQQLPQQIQTIWHFRRKDCIKRLRREDKRTMRMVSHWLEKEGESPHRLTDSLRACMSLWTSCFPVVCLTLDQAREIFRDHKKCIFDNVFWGDAQDLTEKNLFRFLDCGRRHTWFFNPISGGSPVLKLLADRYPQFPLHHVHHFYPGNPWQAWHAGDRTGYSLREAALRFIRVAGQFGTDGINGEEASHLLQELSGLQPDANGQFPSVGVVCLSESQRNFLAMLLFRLAREEGPLREHFGLLFRSGLEILVPEELASAYFQQLYLLTSFQTPDQLIERGSFPSGWIERLANAGQVQVSVLTSIPRIAFIQWEAEEGSQEDGLFAFLQLAEAIGEKDWITLEQVFQQFQPAGFSLASANSGDIFWRELRLLLSDLPEEWECRDHVFYGKDFLPFILERGPSSRRKFFLLDGFHAVTPKTDLRWELFQTRRWQSVGVDFLPVWTVNCWKNAPLESQRILESLA